MKRPVKEQIRPGPVCRLKNSLLTTVLNFCRYNTLKNYLDNLPSTEEKVEDFSEVQKQLKQSPNVGQKSLLIPTPRSTHTDLDTKNGLTQGALVSVVPDDTGRNEYVPLSQERAFLLTSALSPTLGTLVALSPEEVVIKPQILDPPASIDVRIHFPRLAFVIRPVKQSKL